MIVFNDSLIESTHTSHLLVNWTALFVLYVCARMQLAEKKVALALFHSFFIPSHSIQSANNISIVLPRH